MIRGTTLFKCDKRFMALDIEYCATSLSTPQMCPECSSMRTRPSRIVGGSDSVYKHIWNKIVKELPLY